MEAIVKKDQGHTNHALKNSIFGLLNIIVIFVGTFLIRRLIKDNFGQEILGLQSLIADVYTILMLANNAISLATTFILYKPVSEKNYSKIKAFIKLFNKFYLVITGVVLFLGLLIAFVYPLFLNSNLDYQTVVLYFSLLAIQGASGYVFNSYKNFLLADERSRYVSIVHMILRFSFYFLQAIAIVVFKSFLIFSILNVLLFFSESIICVIIYKLKYKHIINSEMGVISKDERKLFYRKMAPALVQGVATSVIVLSNGFVISSLPNLGVAVVAIYSGYSTIAEAFKNIYSQFFASFTNGYGNYIQNHNNDENYSIYKKSLFFARGFSFICCIGFSLLGTLVVNIWLGDEFVLAWYDLFFLILGLYFYLMYVPAVSVQNCTALHSKDIAVPFIQGAINLGGCFLFGSMYGITGIVVTTAICNLIPLISKEIVINKFFFKGHHKETTLYHVISFLITIPACLLMCYVSTVLPTDMGKFVAFLKYFLVALTILVIVFIITHMHTKEYKYFVKKLRGYLHI